MAKHVKPIALNFALEIQHRSSGAGALPSTAPRHPVQQFQIGGEHVAR